LDSLVAYGTHVAPRGRSDNQVKNARERICRTLEDRPWEKCPCDICKRWGIEIVIFRGNNRNRRRGFHNTYVFYQIIGRVLAGGTFPWFAGRNDRRVPQDQFPLFSATV